LGKGKDPTYLILTFNFRLIVSLYPCFRPHSAGEEYEEYISWTESNKTTEAGEDKDGEAGVPVL
jgi:hypothetical protein